jgi:thiamine pyrophosphokinase
MSSHHIVREKQEPALIIANGEACSSEILNQLLEWSPTVVVLDGAFDRVVALGTKIDVLLGDFDDFPHDFEEIKKSQYPIEIVHTPDQEKTDLEKAIEYLIEKGHPAVNIVWATGRRADHTFANIANLIKYKNDLKIKLIDDHSIVYPISPLPNIFIKWYKAKSTLSLIPISEAKGISTKNLKYPLINEDLKLGIRVGNSNEALTDGVVEISFVSGDLLIMECVD